MMIYSKDGDFERAQKVEKAAASRRARKLGRKNLRPGTAAEVQSLLTGLGYDPDAADTVIGPLGRKAVERCQAAVGLIANGEVVSQLLANLREAHAPRKTKAETKCGNQKGEVAKSTTTRAKQSPDSRPTQPPPGAQSIRTEIGEEGGDARI